MGWLYYAILAGTGFGVYNFFVKITADKFSPTISLTIISGSAFIVSILGLLLFRLLGIPLLFDKGSLYKPILGGIMYGTALFLSVIMYSRGAPLSLGIPLVLAILTVIVTVLSVTVLHEPLNYVRIIGLIVIITGFFILARS